MLANNNKGWLVAGLVVLGAVGAVGWAMYYLEKQEHEVNAARLARAVELEARAEQASTVENLGNVDQGKVEEMEMQRTELMRERDMLQDRLSATEAERSRLALERETLSGNLKLIKDEHDQLKQELGTMAVARKQLRSDLEDAQEALDRVTAELSEKIQAREQMLSETTNTVESINAQLLTASGKIDNLEQERQQIRARFAELRQRLESDLQSKDVEIEQLKGDMTLIRLASDILFDPGSVALKDAGRKALALIAVTLNEFPDRQISLEGHTDSVPISESLQEIYETNWELSTARAARAARFLQAQGVTPERIRAVGYGPYRPVADNEDPTTRALNRRLEIMLLPAAQEVQVYEVSSN